MELTPPGPAVLATVFSYPHEKHIRAFCPVFDGQTPNGVSQQQLTNEVTFGPILGDVRLFSLGATGCYGLTGSTVRRAVPPTKTPVGPCMPGWRGQVRCLQTPQHCVVVAPYCWKSRLAGIPSYRQHSRSKRLILPSWPSGSGFSGRPQTKER